MTQRLITALVLASISALSTAVDLEKTQKAVGSDLVNTGFATTFGDLEQIQSSELQLVQSTNLYGRCSACENGKCNYDYVFWCDILDKKRWGPNKYAKAKALAIAKVMVWFYDTNGDNKLDKAEFLQFWMYALGRAGGVYCDADFQSAWHDVKNCDGYVTICELKHWIYNECPYSWHYLSSTGKEDAEGQEGAVEGKWESQEEEDEDDTN